MAPIRSLLAAGLLFLSTANAHFALLQPTPLEGDDMNEGLEGNAPCGGGAADLSKNTATDFHVDGDSIVVQLGHPQGDYLFRATLDSKAAGNWTELYPIFTQNNRGNLCQPAVKAPKEWVGKKGFIGVACNAPDGLLYQVGSLLFFGWDFPPIFLENADFVPPHPVRRRQLCLGCQHNTGLVVHQRLHHGRLQHRPGSRSPRRRLELELDHPELQPQLHHLPDCRCLDFQERRLLVLRCRWQLAGWESGCHGGHGSGGNGAVVRGMMGFLFFSVQGWGIK